jgi:hypothetical protein
VFCSTHTLQLATSAPPFRPSLGFSNLTLPQRLKPHRGLSSLVLTTVLINGHNRFLRRPTCDPWAFKSQHLPRVFLSLRYKHERGRKTRRNKKTQKGKRQQRQGKSMTTSFDSKKHIFTFSDEVTFPSVLRTPRRACTSSAACRAPLMF